MRSIHFRSLKYRTKLNHVAQAHIAYNPLNGLIQEYRRSHERYPKRMPIDLHCHHVVSISSQKARFFVIGGLDAWEAAPMMHIEKSIDSVHTQIQAAAGVYSKA